MAKFSFWRFVFLCAIMEAPAIVEASFDCTLNPDIHADIVSGQPTATLCKGFLDVTLPPYNAHGDGVTDDSAAIAQAVQGAYDNSLVAFFPGNKRYLISQQIRCVTTSNDWSHAYNGFQLVGSTKGTPPVLVLADGSSVTDNIFIYFQLLLNGKAYPPSHYSSQFRGIDIDMGDNPGVSALSMSGAQRCSIEDTHISGKAFYAGIRGLPGSGGFSGNIKVDGGQIGIWQEQFRPNPSVTNLVLHNQTLTGVWHQISRGPLVISGFEIRSPAAPSADYRAFRVEGTQEGTSQLEGDGSLALEDGSIVVEGENSVAVQVFEANIAFRNVYFQADTTVEETTPKDAADVSSHVPLLRCDGTGAKAWNLITNWVRTEHSSAVKVGSEQPSSATTFSYPKVQTAHPCGNSDGPQAGLNSIHSWNSSSVPSWEDDDLVDLITDYGATPEWTGKVYDDDGKILQQALTDTANPNHEHYKKTVFIPHGTFGCYKTVVVPTGSRILGAGKLSMIKMVAIASKWPSVEEPLLKSDDTDAPIDRTYGLVMVDLHLKVHARGQTVALRTDKILWKSVVTASSGLESPASFTDPLAAGVVFSGHAGGYIYGLTPGPTNHDPTTPEQWGPNFSLTQISGTSNPLHFYQMSIEHQACKAQVLVQSSSNVNFHAFKFESVGIGAHNKNGADTVYGGSLVRATNSDHITFFGGSGNYVLNFPEVSSNILEFEDTTHAEVWLMVRRTANGDTEMENGNWLSDVDSTTSSNVVISDDLNILYYNSEPDPTSAPTSAPTSSPTASPTVEQVACDPSMATGKNWGSCYSGGPMNSAKCCNSGFGCYQKNKYYGQCRKVGNVPSDWIGVEFTNPNESLSTLSLEVQMNSNTACVSYLHRMVFIPALFVIMASTVAQF